MEIMLNTTRSNFFILDSSYSLSSDNPGPKTINFGSLTRQSKINILTGLEKGDILSPQKEKLFELVYGKTFDPLEFAQREDQIKEEIESNLDTRINLNQNFENKAKQLLDNNTNLIKKGVKKISNRGLVILMREMEEDNRRRKTVLAALDDRIEVLTKEYEKKMEEAQKLSDPSLPLELSMKHKSTNEVMQLMQESFTSEDELVRMVIPTGEK